MAAIENVTIVGASGNLGQYVLKELLRQNLNVTVLTRSRGNISYDDNIKVTEADFTSVDSLTTAFQSQDAIISTVGRAGIEDQKLVIDAAIAAGVRRFIPSDFGVCTTNSKVSGLPFYSTLANIQQYLMHKAAISPLSYTILAPGSFLEYFLMSPNVIDFKNQAVAFIDGGNNRVSTTTMLGIGKAVAGILNNPDKTKNRTVFVAEAILTQRQVLGIATEIKPEIKWTTSDVKSSDILKDGLDAVASGDNSLLAMGKILLGTAFGGGEYGAAYDENDNELLGIESIAPEQLRSLIAGRLA